MEPIQPVGRPFYIPDFYKKYVVTPGTQIKLSNYDPNDTCGLELNKDIKALFISNRNQIRQLLHLIYSENKQALLGVVQGMDTAGKDGVIKHLMRGVDHRCCEVTHFKAPTSAERQQTYLYRIFRREPKKGRIGWFHRSHYEDILPVRVKNLVPENVWRARYDQINNFEKYLTENNVQVLKFFLYMSENEQKNRLIERRDKPNKQWKLSPDDIKEREHWDKYMEAYEDAISKCSTDYAPWFIIPANNKWFRDLVVSQLLLESLQKMSVTLPVPSFDPSKIQIE